MKFSIITVTYNAGKSLKNTLDSIRIQKFKDYELILIDGKSTDDTLEIIHANKDIISSFISEKDKGIYDAMNKGIKLANGEFCVFLNSGDMFYNETVLMDVSSVIEQFSQYDIYLGYADYTKGKDIKTVHPNISKLPYVFCHQAMFFRTEVIKLNNYDVNYKLSGDSELFYRLLSKGKQLQLMNVKVVLEETGAGATYDNLWKSSKELYEISFLKEHTSVGYRFYRLTKILAYLMLRKLNFLN